MLEKKKPQISPFTVINHTIMILLAIVTIFPFYNIVIVSLADYKVLAKSPLYLFPTSFDFEAYRLVFMNKNIFNSFFVSFFITGFGTFLSLLMTTAAAYAFSKKTLPGRSTMFLIVILTMYFSGGLIPSYLTIKAYGLIDNIFVLILPNLISAFNIILMANYFASLPHGLEESAKIEGANDLYILARIVIPISMPIIATIGLFYSVGYWNEWWLAKLYLSDKSFWPLQMALREVLFNFNQMAGSEAAKEIAAKNAAVYTRSVQSAVVVITVVPILFVYPFIQRYFTKGILLGAEKG